jgi:hypothetical protein
MATRLRDAEAESRRTDALPAQLEIFGRLLYLISRNR